ncbi:N-methyl-L-tryptophan oxidase [Rhodococcus sp. JS3073]|uniref:N-methyl-L-tryptophan oxidase n=1 Tax=Rhodococcus sp. JS3073 TaxID=3002901 RepID=UPI0022861EA4|nr:N-methyl-L-tryptophan oxidase [Rhodococcus sp. JS3073]WAM19893.1 N-methyl-L-tryptophan oxidase [Rhodococcus sp. JS3073]
MATLVFGASANACACPYAISTTGELVKSPKVAVIGLGTMGAQCLWQLSRRGIDVTGYETYAPGHARAGAGGDSRLFRTVELEDARYSPVVARADELWDELQKESRRELRTITGVLLTGAPEDPEMQRAVQNAAATGTPHMIWNERTLVRRIPQFRPDPGDIAIWDARGGFIRPELSVATAAGVAERLGARICRNRQVLEVSQSSDRVHIRTDAGTDIYDQAIVAVGVWTPKLLPRFRDLIMPRRLISAWFFARDAEYLAGLPPFIRPLSTYAYGVPTVDGNAVKIGLGFAHHMRADDPDQVERTVQPDELAPFQEVVQRYLPGLDPHPMRTETYLEGYTPTRREWIGEHPDMPGVLVLAGFSGHGFKECPAIGEAAVDRLLGSTPTVDLDFLEDGRAPF